MGSDDRQNLLRTAYACEGCPERYGFARPGPGRPYYKFPPTIGATGQADVLFVGINPRRTGNQALHDALMADFGAFERLAGNWDGRQRYIAPGGPEAHYRGHVEIVQGVFGAGARFEDHAAVTELFLCATGNSGRLPAVLSECADKYLQEVMRVVVPRVVVCVGARVLKYFVARYGRTGGAVRVSCGGLAAEVVAMPHPNAWMSRVEREQKMGAVVGSVRATLRAGTGGGER